MVKNYLNKFFCKKEVTAVLLGATIICVGLNYFLPCRNEKSLAVRSDIAGSNVSHIRQSSESAAKVLNDISAASKGTSPESALGSFEGYDSYWFQDTAVRYYVDELTFSDPVYRGSKGEDVLQLQAVLTSLGYYDGKVDGSFGPGTDKAVRRLQADYGVIVDGSVGPGTRGKINEVIAGTAEKVEPAFSEAADILDRIGWDIKTAYRWVVNHSYFSVGYNFTETTQWYANYFFQNGGGNCYCFSCAFYELAKTLGYDAHVVNGYVPYEEGGYGLHSWVEIDQDGTTWVYDPEFEREEGGNGYKFRYKTSGTWMYTDYGRVN